MSIPLYMYCDIEIPLNHKTIYADMEWSFLAMLSFGVNILILVYEGKWKVAYIPIN